MTWVQDQLDDECLFPSKIGTIKYAVQVDLTNLPNTFSLGVPFPKNFVLIAKTILKRLFRVSSWFVTYIYNSFVILIYAFYTQVYAHIYHQHFVEVVQLGEEAHLNTSFKHFIFFVQEFSLIERKELAPLQELIEKLTCNK